MVRIVSNIPNSTGEILNKDEMLQVGVITDTHGIKGEVKVYPTTDDVNRFDYLKKAEIPAEHFLNYLDNEEISRNIMYFQNAYFLNSKGAKLFTKKILSAVGK